MQTTREVEIARWREEVEVGNQALEEAERRESEWRVKAVRAEIRAERAEAQGRVARVGLLRLVGSLGKEEERAGEALASQRGVEGKTTSFVSPEFPSKAARKAEGGPFVKGRTALFASPEFPSEAAKKLGGGAFVKGKMASFASPEFPSKAATKLAGGARKYEEAAEEEMDRSFEKKKKSSKMSMVTMQATTTTMPAAAVPEKKPRKSEDKPAHLLAVPKLKARPSGGPTFML